MLSLVFQVAYFQEATVKLKGAMMMLNTCGPVLKTLYFIMKAYTPCLM